MTIRHPDGVTLSEYVDDGLTPAAQAEVAAHLASCAECRSLVEAFRAMTSAVRALPPMDAPRSAWPRIERELRRPHQARRGTVWSTFAQGFGGRALWLAAAAAIVLATLAGLKVADMRRQPAETAASAEAPTAQSIEAELLQAEQHYQKAIAGLEQIANAEKGALDPQTAATLAKNLTVIDQAISESRAALRAQPSSEPAQASLLESFKSKVTLLQDTVALINEMRRIGLTQKGT